MIYIQNITTGFLIFSMLALFLTLPYLAYNYFKFGSVVWKRALLVYAFLLYCITAFVMVVLPLPSIETVANMTGPTMQLVPFNVIWDFITQTVFRVHDSSTYLPALKQGVFTQPIFNLILTLPLGVFMRRLFNLNFKQTLVVSFACALFFELTQLSGLYGIYPRPYRLFDVDDLMLNTLGGLLGYKIAPLFAMLFISKEQMIETARSHAEHVSLLRRLVALIIDNILVDVFMSTLFNLNNNAVNAVGYVIYTILALLIFKNATIGMRLTRIKFESDTSNLKVQVMKRVLLYVVFVLLIPQFLNTLTRYVNTQETLDVITVASVVIIGLTYMAILIGHLLWESITRHNWFFYERLSQTHIVSTYAQKNLTV